MDNVVLDTIRRRRTIRRFTEEPVDDKELETLLSLAMRAPSRLNRRPWHFVVIRDVLVRKRLAELLRIHPYLEAASAVIAVCAKPKASPTWMMDVSAAIENMLIGATALGLGTAWVGAPDTVLWSMCEEVLRDTLAIPPDVRVPALIAVGHPDPSFLPGLRSDGYDETRVHYDSWDRHGMSAPNELPRKAS